MNFTFIDVEQGQVSINGEPSLISSGFIVITVDDNEVPYFTFFTYVEAGLAMGGEQRQRYWRDHYLLYRLKEDRASDVQTCPR